MTIFGTSCNLLMDFCSSFSVGIVTIKIVPAIFASRCTNHPTNQFKPDNHPTACADETTKSVCVCTLWIGYLLQRIWNEDRANKLIKKIILFFRNDSVCANKRKLHTPNTHYSPMCEYQCKNNNYFFLMCFSCGENRLCAGDDNSFSFDETE